MQADGFVKLVADLRHSQKEFFRTRSDTAMRDAKRLEREVDKAIENLLKPSLFSGEPG